MDNAQREYREMLKGSYKMGRTGRVCIGACPQRQNPDKSDPPGELFQLRGVVWCPQPMKLC